MRRRPNALREGWGDLGDLVGWDRSPLTTFAMTPLVVLMKLLTAGMVSPRWTSSKESRPAKLVRVCDLSETWDVAEPLESFSTRPWFDLTCGHTQETATSDMTGRTVFA